MGGIRLCNEMVKNYFDKGTTVYVSGPTWGPHRVMPTIMGIPWKEYRYFDKANNCFDCKAMMEDLSNAPSGSVVLI